MTNKEAILNFLNDRRLAIIAKMNRATGGTERSLRTSAGNDYGFLVAPSYIETLDKGRKPTKDSAPAGQPTLRESLKLWIDARNIKTRDGQTEESLLYAMSKSIHEKGTKLYREKRVSGVLSDTLTEEQFKKLIDQLAEINLLEVSSKIIKDFRINLEK